MNKIEKDLMDSFVVCGKEYLEIRNCLKDAFTIGKFDTLQFSKVNNIFLIKLKLFFYFLI